MASINVTEILRELAGKRPVFHSKADLKDALAECTKRLYPASGLAMSYPPLAGQQWRVDLWVTGVDGPVAINAMYRTRSLKFRTEADHYDLKTHGAADCNRYDYWRSLSRLEEVVSAGAARAGYTLLLTNEYLYWRPPARPHVIDEPFHLYDGRNISGRLAWASEAGPGTTDGRSDPIDLLGQYRPRWTDYSCLFSEAPGTFRYLLLST